jgi:transposase
MKQTELRLKPVDRAWLRGLRSKGVHGAREVNRAHVLVALAEGVSERTIMEVLGVSRSTVWRTRQAYVEQGASYAVADLPRSGQPPKYGTDEEAEIVALACSAPPSGAVRWTLKLLAQAAGKRPGLKQINRENVRRMLKKTSANPGAK